MTSLSSRLFFFPFSRPGRTLLAATVCLLATLPCVRAQITADITSPPQNISVIAGQPLQLAASIRNPDANIEQIQFIFNGRPLLQFPLNGPYVREVNLPNAAGSYSLELRVTDTDGNVTTDQRTITVVPADRTNDPVPGTALITDLTGRTILGGTVIVLTATAESNRADGRPLGRVDFYADNTLLGSYDGDASNDVTAAARSLSHTSAVNDNGPAANGTVFSTTWNVPETDGLVNLITVATTTTGRSRVSTVVPVRVTTATTNQPPTVAILSVLSGEQFPVNATINIPVTASDPDRTSGASRPQSVIAQVSNYINRSLISTSATSPYGFPYAVRSAGTYVINSIATDGLGLSTVAVPVIIRAVGATTVNLVKPGKRTVNEGAGPRRVKIVRGGDLSQPLTVNYRVAGGAVAGVDYRPLSGTVTFPAGISRVRIKVRALPDGQADGNKTLKLVLSPDENGTYVVGAPARVNLRIIDVN